MSKPNSIVSSERTRGGALLTSTIQLIRQYLLHRGLILLPSDTGYSMAALAIVESAYNDINTLLSRKEEPISLAFPDFLRVRQWVELNTVAAILLERFTPGPITVVCNANSRIPVEFTTETIGSKSRTIGVRIPDSIVERQVAACTSYLTTTAAVRNPKDGRIVQNFEEAVEIVTSGIPRIGNPSWIAVEGSGFYGKHSTVVHVNYNPEGLRLIREGEIPFEKVKGVMDTLPAWAFEDWT